MVNDQASLDHVAVGLRSEFVADLADPCLRPLLAGLGSRRMVAWLTFWSRMELLPKRAMHGLMLP